MKKPTRETIWVVMKYTKDGAFPLRAFRDGDEAYKNLACLKETADLQKSGEEFFVSATNLWTFP